MPKIIGRRSIATPIGEPTIHEDGVEIDIPEQEVSPMELVVQAYGSMTVTEQENYQRFVVDGAFYLDAKNPQMAVRQYQKALAVHNPASASSEEKAFVAAVQQLLGVSP